MDLPKFAYCNYVAKMQKLRGKSGAIGVNRWVNVAFTMFASD